jgi:AcrR family transcriptional regulator
MDGGPARAAAHGTQGDDDRRDAIATDARARGGIDVPSPDGRPGSARPAGGALRSDGTRSAGGKPNRGGNEVMRHRPSLGGGIPAQERELGALGRQTVRRLLEAGLAEFDERGFQAVRVDDIVKRARTSHGTFYLYFANKDDLFRTLLRDALHDMQNITDDFPVVTPNPAGRAALRQWIESFCDTYAAHGSVIRALSQADIVGEEVYGDGLQLMFRLSEAITQGMTAARVAEHAQASRAGQEPADDGGLDEHAELTALACLMMLERINYLLSVEVQLPREEMIDRLSAIIYAAFNCS